ncbi:MAG: hypothetical protein AB2A00_35635, partial [Myxococcota bacterium]
PLTPPAPTTGAPPGAVASSPGAVPGPSGTGGAPGATTSATVVPGVNNGGPHEVFAYSPLPAVPPRPSAPPAGPLTLQLPFPPEEDAQPALTGIIAGVVVSMAGSFLMDSLGSLVALVPVVGVIGLVVGGAGALIGAPALGWLTATVVGKKRVPMARSIGMNALVHLAFMPLRLLSMGLALAPVAALGLFGLRTIVMEGNFVLNTSPLSPGFVLPAVYVFTALIGCGMCVGTSSLVSGIAEYFVLQRTGRARRSWENSINLDFWDVPSVLAAWTEQLNVEDKPIDE